MRSLERSLHCGGGFFRNSGRKYEAAHRTRLHGVAELLQRRHVRYIGQPAVRGHPDHAQFLSLDEAQSLAQVFGGEMGMAAATEVTASPPPLNVTNLNFAPGTAFSSR